MRALMRSASASRSSVSAARSVGWRVFAVHSSEGACAGGGGAWPASSSSWALRMRWRSVGSIPLATSGGSWAWSSCSGRGSRAQRARIAGSTGSQSSSSASAALRYSPVPPTTRIGRRPSRLASGASSSAWPRCRRQELLETEGLARRRGCVACVRLLHLFADACLEHGVDAGVDAGGQRLAVDRQRGQERGMARVRGPQLGRRVRGRRGFVAALEQLERAEDALAVGRLDPLCDRVRQLRVECRGSPRVAGPASADRGIDGRPEVELGQRGPQVQARAADDDRPPFFCASSCSIVAWARWA